MEVMTISDEKDPDGYAQTDSNNSESEEKTTVDDWIESIEEQQEGSMENKKDTEAQNLEGVGSDVSNSQPDGSKGVKYGNIPNEIKQEDRWVCWQFEENGEVKHIDPNTGESAAVDGTDTWASFESARSYHDDNDTGTDGISFVLTRGGPYIGVKLNNCVDTEGGEVDDWAGDIIKRLDSYTELSPTGSGLHVIVKGSIPSGGNKNGDVGIYDRGRFFRCTGNVYSSGTNDVKVRQEELTEVHEEYVKNATDELRDWIADCEDNPKKGERSNKAANVLREQVDLKTVNDTIWVCHDDGIWRDDGEEEITRLLDEGLGEAFTSGVDSDTKMRIKSRNRVTRDELRPPEGTIPVANGLLDLRTREVRDIKPEDGATFRLPVEHDKSADCPRFKEFLQQSVKDKNAVKRLQEMVGYGLHHWGVPHKKALMLLGPTDAGKSQFLKIVQMLFGRSNVATQSPQYIANERWGIDKIVDKPVNIRHDLDPNRIQNMGKVKEIIAGDPMTAEAKNSDPYEVEPKAKHLFAANRSPERDTDDKAFWNRWITETFPESVPKGKQKPNLAESIFNKESSGILNWAVEGWKRLQKQGGFTDEPEWYENKEIWEAYGSSIDRFVDACVDITKDSDDYEPKKGVYSAYTKFASSRGMEVETQNALTRELKSKDGVGDGQRSHNGERPRVYTGLKLTDDAP